MRVFQPSIQLRAVALAILALWSFGLSSASADLESRTTPLVRAVADARPSVVNIRGRKTVRERLDNFSQIDKQVNGMGTGIVIDDRGYIITNYHVIEGVAQIQVGLHDKSTTTAKLIAHDPKTDLAIIKIAARSDLPVIKIGNSDTLMPAETVVAVGNAFGYEHTVTRGIISELRRTVQVSENQIYYDLIQTDASINPGNSGGPLLNIDGEMIGINVAVRVGAQGIGFAIPVNEALEVAARLMGEHASSSTFHGLKTETEHMADGQTEVRVTSVDSKGAAAEAGIQVGDQLVRVGDIDIHRSLDLQRAWIGRKPGEQVGFEFRRDGLKDVASVTLQRASNSQATNQTLCWERLGLRLTPIAANDFVRISSRYDGGMRVTSVRANSPASKQGIRANDILVGMHIWQTVSYENVAFVLSRPETQNGSEIRFYILRGSDTLWGNIRLAQR